MYEGTAFSHGLRQQNPYLQRAFASFDDLWQPQWSPQLATALLGPLLAALQTSVASKSSVAVAGDQ
jgi:hypothetical protein